MTCSVFCRFAFAPDDELPLSLSSSISSRVRLLELGRLVKAGVIGAGGDVLGRGRGVAFVKGGGGRPSNKAAIVPSSSS